MGTMDHARISTVAVESGKLKFQLNGVPSRPANGRAGWRPRRPSCSPTLRELNALAVRSMPSYDGTAVGDGSAVTLRRRFVVFASSQSEPAPSEAPRPLRRRVAFPAEPGNTPFTPAEFEISRREDGYERKRVCRGPHLESGISHRKKLCNAVYKILGLESWFSGKLLVQLALAALPGVGFIVAGLFVGAVGWGWVVTSFFIVVGIFTLVASLVSECFRDQIFSAAVGGYRGGGVGSSVWMLNFMVVLWILVWELIEGPLMVGLFAVSANPPSAPVWWSCVLVILCILPMGVPLVWGVLVCNAVTARRPAFYFSHFRQVVLEKCDRNIELFEEFDPVESEVDQRDLAVVANLVAANELYVERRVSSPSWCRRLSDKTRRRAENRRTDLCIRLRTLLEDALNHPLPELPVD